ncbi:hypothetical protein HPY86_08090 [candidate division WOR-3 bacterium]|jgi:hypothetical protein|nr:hypothetical protein [candidate division WOR-3 bacterium]
MKPKEARVFIRARAPEPVWQVFPFSQAAPDSSDIKAVEVAELVRRKPDFLNFAEPSAAPFRVAVPVTKNFGVGSPILVAVDEAGGVFLVGCPDESSPDAYRTVVADILAASTRLWRMSYEQFSQIFTEVEGATLEELMLLRSRADWDFEQFEPIVAANLEKGRFPILIVTAHPGGEVRQVLEYLKGMNLVVVLVSYSLWVRGGILVVEPVSPSRTLLGVPSAPVGFAPPPSPPREEPPVVQQPVEVESPPVIEEEEGEKEPIRSIPAGALPTEPAKSVAKPPGPGTKPGVMAGKRPPPKPKGG